MCRTGNTPYILLVFTVALHFYCFAGVACAVGGFWFYQMYQTAAVNSALMIPLLLDAAVSTLLFDFLFLRACSESSNGSS